MAARLQLHQILETFCPNIYFQPPTNTKIIYPCIMYRRDMLDTDFADNKPYNLTQRYMVTIIDTNPDSEIPMKVANLPTSIFNRFYTADNLNHDVYSVYF